MSVLLFTLNRNKEEEYKMNFILISIILCLIVKGAIDKKYYKSKIKALNYQINRYKEMTDTLCKKDGDNQYD